MSDTIDSKRRNCTLVAVREVSRLPDDVIFTAFRKRHYKDNQGMFTDNWIGAAKDLGLQVEEVNFEKVGLCTDDQDRQYPMQFRETPTLKAFIEQFNEGTYFVTVPGHALVVRDGKIVDHNRRHNYGFRRKLRCAHRVLNAPTLPKAELTSFLVMPRFYVKNRRSASGQRWYAAYLWLKEHKDVTVEDLVSNTSYTMADFKHDIKKGLLVYKPVASN